MPVLSCWAPEQEKERGTKISKVRMLIQLNVGTSDFDKAEEGSSDDREHEEWHDQEETQGALGGCRVKQGVED